MRHIYIDDDNDAVCETEIYIDENWSLEERMNLRSIFNCTVKDANGATIESGKEINFYNDLTLVWGGIIEEDEDEDYDSTNLWFPIKVQDYSRLCSRILIKKAYDNKSVDQIVNDFITRYFATYSITAGTIETNLTTINIISFNYIDGESALNELCKFGNYIWEVDKNKQLNFYTIGYITNSTALNDTSQYYNMKRRRSLANYFNKAYIKGDKKITTYRTNETPTPIPDGNSKTFLTRYPVASLPDVEYKLAGGSWIHADVGVLGFDSGKEFYFTYNSENIVQDDGETALDNGAGDAIRINYYGLVPLFVVVNDTSEITSKGIYEAYIKNLLLKDTLDALNYGRELLIKYAEIADNITFDLYEKTYEPGEQFYLSNTKRSITNELFLVDSVNWIPRGPEDITYIYKVLDGASLGGWETYFSNLLNPEKVEISDNEVIIILKESAEDYTYEGEYNLTILDALYPEDDPGGLYPEADPGGLYPGTIADTDTVND